METEDGGEGRDEDEQEREVSGAEREGEDIAEAVRGGMLGRARREISQRGTAGERGSEKAHELEKESGDMENRRPEPLSLSTNSPTHVTSGLVLTPVSVRQSQRARVPSKKTAPAVVGERERAASPSQQPRKRGVRCMECPACLRIDDCGACVFCRDKPKFGGPGVKKQACM